MLQLPHTMWCVLLTFFIIALVDAGPAARYVARQVVDSTTVASLSVTVASSASQTSSASQSMTTETGTSSAGASSISNSSTSQTMASTTLPSLVAPTSSVQVVQPSVFNSTATPNLLPLTPIITPAFSVAGALLLITGLAYAFIGIKSKRLQIFLSASYLTNLAITILVIFVMNPPISNGLQGAYLSGIVIPGIVIGAAATILPDMTEGIGCILGGFCLAMWILVLKPNGLITSTTGVAITIAIFCGLSLATSFSGITRPYGLIFSLSFGGATSIVLGVDCFSRAGLKEFWAWIWRLNDDLFPLGATTYPITRGMKVEIAAIFVIFLFALAAQLQLWKVMARRRADGMLKQRKEEENREREEENVGREIEERSRPERHQWEAVYGNGPTSPGPPRSLADSGVGEMDGPKKTSTSASMHRFSTEESIEMADRLSMVPGSSLEVENAEQLQDIIADAPTDSTQQKQWVVGANGEAKLLASSFENTKDNKTTSEPAIIPSSTELPTDLHEDQEYARKSFSDDSRRTSTANDDISASQELTLSNSRGLEAASSSLKQLSKTTMRNSQRPRGMEGAFESDDLNEADRRSSIAATVDGFSEKDDLESLSSDILVVSPIPSSFLVNRGGEKRLARPVSMIELRRFSFGQGETPSSQGKEEKLRPKSMAFGVAIVDVTAAENVEVRTELTQPTLTEDVLPSSAPPSKVVTSYRTNEWAKHLSHAEAPIVEKLTLSRRTLEKQQPQVALIRNHDTEVETPVDVEAEQGAEELREELPAPLDIKSLQQTAIDATPAPAPMLRPARENARMSKTRQHEVLPKHRNSRTQFRPGSRQSMQRAASNLSLALGFNKGGNIPSPSSAPFYSHNGMNGSSSTPNLLSQRQSILKQKHSFMSLKPLSSTPEVDCPPDGGRGTYSPEPSTPGLSAGDSASVYSQSLHEVQFERDDDSMSLKERKALIMMKREGEARGKMTSPYRVEHYPAGGRRSSTNRSPSFPTQAQKDAQMAQWRASVKADLHGLSARNSTARGMDVVGGHGMPNGYSLGHGMSKQYGQGYGMPPGYVNGYGMGGPSPSPFSAHAAAKFSGPQDRDIDSRREWLVEEKRREEMMERARRGEEERRSREREEWIRGGALDGRSGVEGAHREVMRRLQGRVGRGV